MRRTFTESERNFFKLDQDAYYDEPKLWSNPFTKDHLREYFYHHLIAYVVLIGLIFSAILLPTSLVKSKIASAVRTEDLLQQGNITAAIGISTHTTSVVATPTSLSAPPVPSKAAPVTIGVAPAKTSAAATAPVNTARTITATPVASITHAAKQYVGITPSSVPLPTAVPLTAVYVTMTKTVFVKSTSLPTHAAVVTVPKSTDPGTAEDANRLQAEAQAHLMKSSVKPTKPAIKTIQTDKSSALQPSMLDAQTQIAVLEKQSLQESSKSKPV